MDISLFISLVSPIVAAIVALGGLYLNSKKSASDRSKSFQDERSILLKDQILAIENYQKRLEALLAENKQLRKDYDDLQLELQKMRTAIYENEKKSEEQLNDIRRSAAAILSILSPGAPHVKLTRAVRLEAVRIAKLMTGGVDILGPIFDYDEGVATHNEK